MSSIVAAGAKVVLRTVLKSPMAKKLAAQVVTQGSRMGTGAKNFVGNGINLAKGTAKSIFEPFVETAHIAKGRIGKTSKEAANKFAQLGDELVERTHILGDSLAVGAEKAAHVIGHSLEGAAHTLEGVAHFGEELAHSAQLFKLLPPALSTTRRLVLQTQHTGVKNTMKSVVNVGGKALPVAKKVPKPKSPGLVKPQPSTTANIPKNIKKH